MFRTLLLVTAAVVGLGGQVYAECLGHVHYMADGGKKAETFEITAMEVNKKTGEKLYGGHGTDWYAPADIKITGQCEFHHNSEGDDKTTEYFSIGALATVAIIKQNAKEDCSSSHSYQDVDFSEHKSITLYGTIIKAEHHGFAIKLDPPICGNGGGAGTDFGDLFMDRLDVRGVSLKWLGHSVIIKAISDPSGEGSYISVIKIADTVK